MNKKFLYFVLATVLILGIVLFRAYLTQNVKELPETFSNNTLRRIAGDGIILFYSRVPSSFFAESNRWYIHYPNFSISISAGYYESREEGSVPKGALFIQKFTSDVTTGETVAKYPPIDVDRLIIVDVHGQVLDLVSEDGHYFKFNAQSEEFIKMTENEMDAPYVEKTKRGSIIHHGNRTTPDQKIVITNTYISGEGEPPL